MPARLQPKLLTVLKEGYTRHTFLSDLVAGIVVGIVAIPMAIAFAIASGVKPEQGLYTSIIAGGMMAFFSGSRVQISGPTGAFIVVLYGIVQQYGYSGLAVATLIAGALLIAMGLTRMGTLVKFIPFPVIIGFTSGIALIIFSSEVGDFLGLHLPRMPGDFIGKWRIYAQYFHTLNPYALAAGLLSLLIILVTPRISRRVPGSLVAILVVTLVVYVWHWPVETVGTRFGGVPNQLPSPHLPTISWALITQMFGPAVTIALLGSIESLLSAVVADGMIGGRHRSNMELIAQGLGNLVSPLFAGIPATGAIARTATNIKNGGRTPVAAIVHSLTLLLIMLFFGKLAAYIPMPTLAAVLVIVAYNMSEWRVFLRMFRHAKGDIAVLLATFFLTLLINLTVGIEVGLFLSAFFFLKGLATTSRAGFITDEIRAMQAEDEVEEGRPQLQERLPRDVEVFEIHGPLFFGAIETFRSALHSINDYPRVLVLKMEGVQLVDASGVEALEDFFRRTQKEGATLLLAGLQSQPTLALQKSGLADLIGTRNIFPSLEQALEKAKQLADIHLAGAPA